MPIPFDIPTEHLTRFATGDLQRFGTILKDVNTGQIVGHLQETGALQALLQNTPALANPVTAALNAASNVGSNYQLYRLDTKVTALQTMMGGLQTMQVASLALTGLGLGVSVVGFNMLKSRLETVSIKLDKIEAAIAKGFDKQHRNRLQDKEAELAGQLDLAEEGWHARDGGKENWRRVTENLGTLDNFYKSEILETTRNGTSFEALSYLVERYRVCVSTKIECLILRNEYENATAYAKTSSNRTDQMFDDLSPIAIAQTVHACEEALSDTDTIARSRAMAVALRELQDLHKTMPLLIQRVAQLEVPGRDYIDRLKSETKHPLLTLEA